MQLPSIQGDLLEAMTLKLKSPSLHFSANFQKPNLNKSFGVETFILLFAELGNKTQTNLCYTLYWNDQDLTIKNTNITVYKYKCKN